MEQALLSPRLIGDLGAWKFKGVHVPLETSARQTRNRLRQLENIQRHEKSWNNEAKRLENIRRRLEQKQAMERQRRKALHVAAETKIALEQSVTKNERAFLKKTKVGPNKNREAREDKYLQQKEQTLQLKIIQAREKQDKQPQPLQNVRFAEGGKQIQVDLGDRWESKEQRTGNLWGRKQERRRITKIARELLSQARGHASKKETFDSRRQKTIFKIENLHEMTKLREDTEHATNKELKEHTRLQRITKQRLKKLKEATPGTGHYAVPPSDFDVKGGTPSSRIQAAAIFDRKTQSAFARLEHHNKSSFPALSKIRAELKEEFLTPLHVKQPRGWCRIDSKVSIPRGSLPVVAGSPADSIK